ncbi:AAA-like domain-containing protein [Nostoc sp. CENA67]|uniref:AAA-like domain-containing protein n=1 Tax=Amazonocrinis nigriterrae CENA67 TaxID=2794033 RepID=A0A8J7HW82_9NOST|nr:AAA-like domain-containing protein [Amazonocrinis nigriterrae]MBH8567027.1 AAA-like domain-containing protein [Amazonocrinis nigriterrae CENA67]
MNSTSAFTWEKAKQVVEQIVFNNIGEHPKDIEMKVLRGSWEGLTYEKMAEQSHLSVNYLRGDIGPQLWQKLSEALGEEVTKSNFKGALERAWGRQLFPHIDSNLKQLQSPLAELPFPEGSVPLDSPFYIERDNIESICYETVVKSASLIRIKAPKLMGKTSLMTRVLSYAASQNYQTVYLDLSSVERGILTNLDKFLRWLCLMVGRKLKLENRLKDYWDTEILGSNDNCTVYFEEYLLPEIDCPLVLGLDEVDRIFPYNQVVEDFLGMLRSWHEKGKISEQWKQLRLVMAHSTEVYIPLDMNQSPFNAGLPVMLQEFDHKQVTDLAHLHGLNWNDTQVRELMNIVGGHPYLVRLAMYEVYTQKATLKQLLQDASTEAGIYSNHLRRYLETLHSEEAQGLKEALTKVVTSPEPVELDSMQIYKLHSMGLVQRKDNQVMPRCNLYREYFRRVL